MTTIKSGSYVRLKSIHGIFKCIEVVDERTAICYNQAGTPTAGPTTVRKHCQSKCSRWNSCPICGIGQYCFNLERLSEIPALLGILEVGE